MSTEDNTPSNILEQWQLAYESHPKFRFRPPGMSVEDYARQRVLNEVLRFLLNNGTINFEQFGAILDQFELRIHNAPTRNNESVYFIKHFVEFNIFSGEVVPSDHKKFITHVNPLGD